MRGVEPAIYGVERVRAVEMAVASRMLDAIEHVRLDHQHAVLGVDQAVTELGGDDFRDVLVLGDDLDFLVGELAESEAIAQGQHGGISLEGTAGDGSLYSPGTRIRQGKIDADVIVRRRRMTLA